MDEPVRKGEVRLVIKPANAPADSAQLVPAAVFQKTFSTVLAALKTADRELHDKKHRSEFLVSDLRMGSNIFAVCEQPRSGAPTSSIDLLRQVAGSVYRSEFDRAVEHEQIARRVIAIGKAISTEFPATAEFEADTIPLDSFFAEQTKRFARAIGQTPTPGRYYVGSAITSIDGTLESLDYRGATWRGFLVLPGPGEAQIECILDRSKGEDAYNVHGNKRVSVRGRAIYTGDSILPERIEVIEIEPIARAIEPFDIRGTLTGKRYFGDNETLQ